jgi:hypothetical protein
MELETKQARAEGRACVFGIGASGQRPLAFGKH